MKQFHFHRDLSLTQAIDYMQRMERPYRVERTGSSISIVNDSFGWIISEHRFWPKYLRELSRLKAEIKRKTAGRVFTSEYVNNFQVRYEQFRGLKPIEADELDLSKAYLTAAVRLDIISQESFDRLARLAKRWRLRLLGAIATKRRIVEYDSVGVAKSRRTETDYHLRGVWFAICELVNDTLWDLSRCLWSGFLFYWYDNFFALSGRISPGMLTGLGFDYRIKHQRLTPIISDSLFCVALGDGRKFFLPPGRVNLSPGLKVKDARGVEHELDPDQSRNYQELSPKTKQVFQAFLAVHPGCEILSEWRRGEEPLDKGRRV